MKVELISWTKNPIETAARAAAVCYNSEPKEGILKSCYYSGHTSVLEHINFTFEISGVSRALLAQLTRHRMASYSVQSQRYVSMENNSFIIPPSTQENEEIYRLVYDCERNAYSLLLENKVKKEDARMVLPNACETKLVMTLNLRSLSNLCGLRLCTRAQKEIRLMTQSMVNSVLLCEEITQSFKDFLSKDVLVPKCEQGKLKYCSEGKGCCGRNKTAEEIMEAIK